MDIIEMDGYKIHVTVKMPHLYELTPIFSYQFLIFNKEEKIVNYPFSVIIAHNDEEFESILTRYFNCYVNYTEVKVYSKSKFLEMVANNS